MDMEDMRTPNPAVAPPALPAALAVATASAGTATAPREALWGAIVRWTAAVYPGETVGLEAAGRDSAVQHRPHTWHATAQLSNGVRLRFTLVLDDDGVAWVTRYARLGPGSLGSGSGTCMHMRASTDASTNRAQKQKKAGHDTLAADGADGAAVPSPPPQTTTSTTGTPRLVEHVSVAILEDDADIRQLLRDLLADAGYRVREAADGVAGLALLRDTSERMVVLLDRTLPALGGCALLDRVASDATVRARHAVIFMTGSPDRAQEECGETLAALDVPVLSKPFSIDAVLAAVDQAAWRLAAAQP